MEDTDRHDREFYIIALFDVVVLTSGGGAAEGMLLPFDVFPDKGKTCSCLFCRRRLEEEYGGKNDSFTLEYGQKTPKRSELATNLPTAEFDCNKTNVRLLRH